MLAECGVRVPQGPTNVLQVSGGRDSLATLYLLEPRWKDLTVVWCNSGDASQELTAMMQQVRQLVPYFGEVKGTVLQRIANHGLPVSETWLDCCLESIWVPLYEGCRRLGATVIVRGSKRIDPINFIKPGHVDWNGVAYEFPIWDWDDERVVKFLEGRAIQPVYPHDCHGCPVVKPCDRLELEYAH